MAHDRRTDGRVARFRRHAPGSPIAFLDDHTFATYREDEDGEFAVDVRRITAVEGS